MAIESVMPSNHLILCHPLLLPPSILPSIHQAISISAKTEELTDTSADTGVEDGETVNLRGPGDGLLTDKEGVLKSKESVNKSSSVTVASAEASNQLHCTLGAMLLLRVQPMRMIIVYSLSSTK